jgi:8-oxo-dGTP pyrophosphatase MutT (NUDIX family)
MGYVDVVNENNEIVAKVTKEEAHKQGLLHRTVVAQVIGADKRWTLIKQSSDRQDAGKFACPIGGHIESGETEDEALFREANEEYGLAKGFNYRLVGRAVFYREVLGRKENHYYIFYEIYTDQEPALNEESVSFKKFSEEDLRAKLIGNPDQIGDGLKFVLKTFYKNIF